MPLSFMYVSVDMAYYFANSKHSLAFKDGYPVKPMQDVIIGAEAYLLLNKEYPSGVTYHVGAEDICGVVVMRNGRYYSIGGTSNEDIDDLRSWIREEGLS